MKKSGRLQRQVVHQHRAEPNPAGSHSPVWKACCCCVYQVWSGGGTRLQTAFKLPPSVLGYKEHKAGYDYLQESDASCPPTPEPKVHLP